MFQLIMDIPNSGKSTVDALADQWGKLLAIYMNKQRKTEIVITIQDIQALAGSGESGKTIVAQELHDGLHIKLLPIAEAMRLEAQHKSGFGRS
jgi:hypothetical protein